MRPLWVIQYLGIFVLDGFIAGHTIKWIQLINVKLFDISIAFLLDSMIFCSIFSIAKGKMKIFQIGLNFIFLISNLLRISIFLSAF